MAALGYINANRKAKLSRDDVVFTDIYQMIVARIPGEQVVGNKVRLRGTSIASANAGLGPLFVVDGTVTSSIDFYGSFDLGIVDFQGQIAALLFSAFFCFCFFLFF